ncbi:MAG TPA: hypothetical protein VME46_14750 [Acidimicrobiales bacterium]|nr:hypothetical protein [Acidimicrobiales bacterium]
MPEPGTGPPQAPSPLPVRWAKAFGAFWWDFLVGDTPELLVGALAALGVVAALTKAVSANAAAIVAFPVLVVVLLAGSVYRARRPPS